jgi:hypothetical protein
VYSVESFLTLMMVHLLKLRVWPDSDACNRWRGEIVGFQQGANKHFTAFMRQKIDIDDPYSWHQAIEGRGAQHRLPGREPVHA